MSLGRLQIKNISPAGEQPPTYEIIHENYDGGEFVGSVQGDHLGRFLHETLRMDDAFVERLLDELYLKGKTVVPDVSLSDTELAASGLQPLPEDR